jgi:four helix bundle suffix protein
LKQWAEQSVEWQAMRDLGKKHNDAEFFMALCPSRSAEVIANMAIVLIYQADYLLFKQLERLEKDFLAEGGFTERMYRVRKQQRGF